MWDRFRAGASTGDAGAGAGAGADSSSGSGGGAGVVATAPVVATPAAATPPAWSSSDYQHDNSRRQQHQQYQQQSQLQSQPQPFVSRSNKSWQPRTSVIGQRQRQRQPPNRSISGDSHAAAGSGFGYGRYGGDGDGTLDYDYGIHGGQGGYQYNIKGGGPPPSSSSRPSRGFQVQPPPIQPQPPARQQTFPQQPPALRNRYYSQPDPEPREYTGRPTSSVYSQPSFSYSQSSSMHTSFANHRDRVNLHRYCPGGFDEVSPPSSPELPDYGTVPNHDISPIDEEDDFALPRSRPNMSALSDLPSQQRASSRQGDMPSPNARSNIPMMRRERRQLKDAGTVGRVRAVPSQESPGGTPPRGLLRPTDSKERLRQPSPVPHSLKTVDSKERLRQPTADHSQNPGSNNVKTRRGQAGLSPVKPIGYANDLGIPTITAERRGHSPVPPRSPAIGPKQQPISDTDPAAAAFTSDRPGWRGASGRTAIVEPLQDNPTVAPLRLPLRSNKRGSPPSSDGPGTAPSPSPSGDGDDIVNENENGNRSEQCGTDLAISSPPETQVKEKDRLQQQQQQMGGGAGAGKRSGVASSMANTFRRFIPSSQRQPSNSGNHTARGSSGNVTPQGYPSPPLSSSPTLLGGGGSAAVNATANVDATADTLNVDADEERRPLPLQQQQPLSAQPSPTASHPPIRRKRVGSGTLSTHLGSGHGEHHQPKDSLTSSVYSQQPESNRDQQQRPSQEAALRPTVDTRNLPGAGNVDSPYVQPPSRFSVTTYATSAYSSTPRESLEQFDRNHYSKTDAPPLPTPPKDIALSLNSNNHYYDTKINSSKPLGDSVMDRSRPKLRSKTTTWDDDNDEPVKISLSKPWMSTAGANSAGINTQSSPPRTRREAINAPRELPTKEKDNAVLRIASESTNTTRPPSIVSVDKALPLPPPEATASSVNDRVAMINAQLQSLGNRRININRSIKQMTELMPRDNLLAAPEVMRKRELEKLKVQELERELADVQREEHDLGMKLHRAYKRLDRHAEYEPTTLWVRRATG